MNKYMRKKTIYLVAGSGLENSGSRGWFNNAKPDNGVSSNFVSCKTLAHALRQFARAKGRHAQIDARCGGKPPRVIKWRSR